MASATVNGQKVKGLAAPYFSSPLWAAQSMKGVVGRPNHRLTATGWDTSNQLRVPETGREPNRALGRKPTNLEVVVKEIGRKGRVKRGVQAQGRVCRALAS